MKKVFGKTIFFTVSIFFLSCSGGYQETIFSFEDFQSELGRLSEKYNVPVTINENEVTPTLENLNRIKNGMELIQRMKNGEFTVFPVSNQEISLVCTLPINPSLRSSVREGSAIVGDNTWICRFNIFWTELDVSFSAVYPWETFDGDVTCAWVHDGQVDLDVTFGLYFSGTFLGSYVLYGYYVIATGEDHFSLRQVG